MVVLFYKSSLVLPSRQLSLVALVLILDIIYIYIPGKLFKIKNNCEFTYNSKEKKRSQDATTLEYTDTDNKTIAFL